MDSAYYAAKVIAAIRRAGARFSVTVPMDPKVKAAIAAIGEDAWTAIRYPRAIWDDQLRAWVSDRPQPRPDHGLTSPDPGHRTLRPSAATRTPAPKPEIPDKPQNRYAAENPRLIHAKVTSADR
jgi:hypothetical protein